MTNQPDSDRSTSTETTSEVTPQTQHPGDPWERDEVEQDKPDATPISDPPDHGVDYYNPLIDLESCSYTYLKKGSMLQFSWQGEIRDIDEFKKALYQLYKSMYKSDLSAADLRPKAFKAFAAEAVSEHLKATLYRKPIEGPPGPHNQANHRKTNKRIADIFHAAAALACDHRERLGRRAQPKDAVLKSILPDHIHKQSV